MNIVVLLKQVPDTESVIELSDSGDGINTEDVKWVINPYDEYSLEEALLIKESREDVKVTVLTAGDSESDRSIRTAYALGVDGGVRIDTSAIPELDSLGTATILAAALKMEGCDLVLAGQRAVDDDNYQVPAMVAEELGFPLLAGVSKQEIADDVISCHQVIDGGSARVESNLPAVLTTQKGINEPRYPNMRAIMKARKRLVTVLSLADIGLDADNFQADTSLVRIVSLVYAPERKPGRIVEGATAAAKAAELVNLLRDEKGVI
ncbi:MAG: electron transfer flavoprotein subunit beta/FixA family protein [Deltaproteobacteria bacterium]|nr:electron transfer flavoprotein subunit beta/FixA family protein [Deltaproteobacteria bacterium]MBT4641815.1 electron transfer flavoprotein subunit beta/FixA family protein [Deltaproteobacteria bacterium]MBT6500760.1 electron transfer flavoprotein subunit beta/FixA family protein [Deltaproteobacteria bacterium]MBT6615872.1 electron transfer flavoprotein subunit beta/FixA family protein [Deltaproteobacteria bacterium]MBT7151173.1 electron transfer flavoprotein subunit beta/FixA family protein 